MDYNEFEKICKRFKETNIVIYCFLSTEKRQPFEVDAGRRKSEDSDLQKSMERYLIQNIV